MGSLDSVKSTLEEALRELGLKKGLENYEPAACWKEVVGENIASHTEVVRVKKGILFINASAPVWAQELSLIKDELVKKINHHLKKEIVEDIRISSRGIRTEKNVEITNRNENNSRKQVLNNREIGEIKDATKDLGDQEIRESLERLMARDKKYRKQRITDNKSRFKKSDKSPG